MQASEKKEKAFEPPPYSSKPRRPNSAKCFLWISGFIILAVCRRIVYLFTPAFYRSYPRQYMYQNQSLSEVSNRSSVVQPLITKEQTFDIAITVWIRATRTEEEEWRVNQGEHIDCHSDSEERLQHLQRLKNVGLIDQKIAISSNFDQNELHGHKHDLYHPLYSDIVFHGLRLSEKGTTTSINFTVPTEKFREQILNKSFLRATVLLIPNSSSLLDYVVDYSSWIPEEVLSQRASIRTWPSPTSSQDPFMTHYATLHGSPTSSRNKQEKTIAELALESFSLSSPLVEFHDIPSRCLAVASDHKAELRELHAQGDLFVESIDDSVHSMDIAREFKMSKKHPHIITRSHIRAIDETHVMNLEAYDKAHEQLKNTSCGRNLAINYLKRPLLRWCERSYVSTGELKTKLQLEISDADGEMHTEWAYAPFLTALPYASGPMDLIPVPVDRENCADQTFLNVNTTVFDHTDADKMDVTWHISFSGRSPVKAAIEDVFASPHSVNHSQIKYDKVNAQDKAELRNGLRGISKRGAHPRRRVLLIIIKYTAAVNMLLLSAAYWYTRRSTTHISITGQYLLLLSELKSFTIPQQGENDSRVMSALIVAPEIIWRLQTLLRIDLVWKGWIPTLTRMHPSHLERASERLDATTRNVRLALFSCLLIFFHMIPLIGKYQFLVLPLNPGPPASYNWYSVTIEALDSSFSMTGLASQIILNCKSGYFAGSYKARSILVVIFTIPDMLQFVPAFVGTYQTRPSLEIPSIMYWGLSFTMAYQALTLPAATGIVVDKNEE